MRKIFLLVAVLSAFAVQGFSVPVTRMFEGKYTQLTLDGSTPERLTITKTQVFINGRELDIMSDNFNITPDGIPYAYYVIRSESGLIRERMLVRQMYEEELTQLRARTGKNIKMAYYFLLGEAAIANSQGKIFIAD